MKKQEDAVSYGFYSRLLKKPFDSVEELKAAEDEFNKAHAEELRKAEERKSRAKDVEDAYRAVIDAKRQAKAIIEEANRKAGEIIKGAEGRYIGLKNAFIKDYGSFHMSYTDADGNSVVTVSDLFDSMFRSAWF